LAVCPESLLEVCAIVAMDNGRIKIKSS